METNFNFKSQICTTREQSERLVALGLKKETADMVYSYVREEHEYNYYWELDILESSWDSYIWPSNHTFVPAWSLHRLIEMMPTIIKRHQQVWTLSLNGAGLFYLNQDMVAIVEALEDNLFVNIIGCIEWLIKEGYFNKEYLV